VAVACTLAETRWPPGGGDASRAAAAAKRTMSDTANAFAAEW
jgi:hypothetical protein